MTMGLIHIMEKGSDSDVRRFEDSLRMAKEGIKEACEIYKDMKEQFSERRGYDERMGRRSYRKDDWDEMDERRGSYRGM